MANKKRPFCRMAVTRVGKRRGGVAVRRYLRSGVPVRALVAVPAAVSVGLVLASPAAGQTTIDMNKSAPVNLDNSVNYPNGGPFTITNGTTLNTAGVAPEIYGAGQAFSVTNAGTVTAGNANYAVSLGSGGYLNHAGGSVSGGEGGIYVAGGLGTVSNSGSIVGGEGSGVSLHVGGQVTNAAGGFIFGISVDGTAAYVQNMGLVTASYGLGIYWGAGGTANNMANGTAGTISGARFGILTDNGAGTV